MVEYAVLLAGTSLATIGSFTQAAELWLSRLNWEVLGYAVLGLITLRIAVWTFRTR